MITDDEVMSYLKQWVKEDEWDDLNVIINEGDTDLAAYHVYSSGCINHKVCYPDCKQVEKRIQLLHDRFNKLSNKTKNARYAQVFKDAIIITCYDCDHHSFMTDGNETLYPEVLKECWDCQSKNIEIVEGL